MSRITLNSNIQALQANRRIGQSTRALSDSFSRLSSGLRINKASDDAAGLAIAESLKTDSRVYTQGVRNANDGISLLSVAEGAVESLSNILIRMGELAEQSANGTLDNSQRTALHEEAMALRDEYNRIVESTEFNDLALIDSTLSDIALQVGFGTDGSIAFSAGQGLSRNIGTGYYEDPVAPGTTGGAAMITGDFNEDGFADYISAPVSGFKFTVMLGAGDGTFTSGGQYGVAATAITDLAVADFDNDGHMDVVYADQNSLVVMTGDGTGAFNPSTAIGPFISPIREIVVGDFNNDGNQDVLTADASSGVDLFAGDGAGNISTSPVALGSGAQISSGDFNGDGNLDIVTTQSASNIMRILMNDGTGNFTTYLDTAVNKTAEVAVEDLNGDGLDDIVTLRSGTARAHFSQGDGTFTAGANFSGSGSFNVLLLQDLNDDGYVDVAMAGDSGAYVTLFNDGEGEFSAIGRGDATAASLTLAAADFNGDGAIDLAVGDAVDGDAILLAETERSSLLKFFSLQTQDDARAAMSVVDQAMQRVSAELGEIGSVTSRLTSTVRNLAQVTENYKTAESQIRDVDVAEEAANLVRAQILQEAGTAILGQANTLPQLALTLIGES